MTLLLAILLIQGLKLSWGWYLVSLIAWLIHMAYHSAEIPPKKRKL